jgi:hypothetical protein
MHVVSYGWSKAWHAELGDVEVLNPALACILGVTNTITFNLNRPEEFVGIALMARNPTIDNQTDSITVVLDYSFVVVLDYNGSKLIWQNLKPIS